MSIAVKILFNGKEKRSVFNAKMRAPMERNPWYFTATSKELKSSGVNIFFNACAPIAPNTMEIMMASPEKKTNCFCM